MNILIKIFFPFSIFIGVVSCTPHVIYPEPEMIGKIYDDDTKKPISNTQGYIGYYTTRDEKH